MNQDNNNEVYATRESIAKKILDNIKTYGQPGKPGVYGRGYNAGTKTGYPFSAANYLRYLAETEENKPLGYVSEEYALAHGLTINPEAKPLMLERWMDDVGELVPFYNVDDLYGEPIPKSYNVQQSLNDFSYANSLLDAVDISPANNINELKDKVFDYAKNNKCNDLSAAMTVHLFCRNCHIDQPDNLFTEEMIQRAEQNPKELFKSIKTANNINNYIGNALYFAEAHNKAADSLFKDLEVSLDWSEAILTDASGREFKSIYDSGSREQGGVYKGEDAYRLLAAMLHEDKVKYNKNLLSAQGYAKTKIGIRYKALDTGSFRIDLADLELSNKTSAAEAFADLLQHYYHKPEAEKADFYAQLLNDEKEFIKQNPEYKEFNELKANTYKYVVPEKCIEFLHKSNPYFNILSKSPLPSDTVACGPEISESITYDSLDNSLRCMQVDSIKDCVVIEAYQAPDYMRDIIEKTKVNFFKETGEPLKFYPLYSEHEVELLKKIDNLRLEIDKLPSNPYVDSTYPSGTFNEHSMYHGMQAIKRANEEYRDNCIMERRHLYDAVKDGNLIDKYGKKIGHAPTIPDFNLRLMLGDDCIGESNITSHPGSLRDKDFYQAFSRPDTEDMFKELVEVTCKYGIHPSSDEHFDFEIDVPHRTDEQRFYDYGMEQEIYKQTYFPEELIKKSRLSSDDISRLALYYITQNKFEFAHKSATLEKCTQKVIDNMIKDGLSDSKINNICMAIDQRIGVNQCKEGLVSKTLNSKETKDLKKSLKAATKTKPKIQ